ncbi:ABC transporter permease, partial [Burkholderia pseudomultivorans]|nr:ABC transporter permease [Burkholderia pseudomultivorans]MBF5014870.1 ABC transporter permease [Burkholderia pseudomultivorans]
MNTMTIASSAPSSAALKRELKAAEARKRTMALLLVAPLALFVL